jgi:hypothetical protein
VPHDRRPLLVGTFAIDKGGDQPIQFMTRHLRT